MTMNKDYKVSLLIRAYLTLNNHKCTSREISNWITRNYFGLNNTSVHPNMIVSLVKNSKYRNNKLLIDVQLEKENGVNMLWLK